MMGAKQAKYSTKNFPLINLILILKLLSPHPLFYDYVRNKFDIVLVAVINLAHESIVASIISIICLHVSSQP
jgi:hypothetical protein